MKTPVHRARLRSYASLAAASVSAAVGGTADASIVVSNSLQGKIVNWDTGAGNVAATTVNTTFGGLLAGGGGFSIATRATANGRGTAMSYRIGVVARWQGNGSGKFQRGGVGPDQALLASSGAPQNAGTGSASLANVNLGTTDSGRNFGNAAFSGSSKYLLFSFQANTTTYYGWIEILSTTTGSTTPSLYSATLGRWAYDNSGSPITAGQIVASAVPGGAGISALVVGAAGLRGRRRARN